MTPQRIVLQPGDCVSDNGLYTLFFLLTSQLVQDLYVLRRAVGGYERIIRRFTAQTTDYQVLLSTFAEGGARVDSSNCPTTVSIEQDVEGLFHG